MHSYLILTACLLLVCLTKPAGAQKEDEKGKNSFPVRLIALDTSIHTTRERLLFSGITVIDARMDTTFSGILIDPPTKDFFKAEFKQPASEELGTYIRKNYSFEAGTGLPSLLLIIKKLCLTPSVSRHQGTRERARADGISFCAELFINDNGKFHGLYKIDSTYAGIYAAWTDGNLYVEEAIRAILARVENRDISDIHTGKTEFSDVVMQQYVRQSRTCKILEDSAWKSGVYKSFNEFKNNTPAITDYELREARTADSIVYTHPGNGKPIVIKDYWGFCDGENVFIKLHDDIMPMYRYGNTFITFGEGLWEKKGEGRNILRLGSTIVSHSRYRALTPPVNKPATSKATRMPIFVDMETGIAY